MRKNKERLAFTLSKSLKAELEEAVPARKRSQFVEKAIAEALLIEAKRKALTALDGLPVYDTGGRNSVELLRRMRSERADYVASRHLAT